MPSPQAIAKKSGSRLIGESRLLPTRLELLDWRAISRGTLVGFARVRLPNKLVIADIAVHRKDGEWWSSLPAMPQLEGGKHRELDGKKQYRKILEWSDRDIGKQFSAAVVELVRETHQIS